ncbi:midasin isoform X8 [Fagus crenata]
MEQDFAGETCSVTEDDSAEDNNDEDSEDEPLDSAMGETGGNSEVVDEKLWNQDEDEPPNTAATTDEPGELNDDEPGKHNSDELDKQDDEIGGEDNLGDTENIEETNLDKEEAFADPSGLKLDESNQCSDEDMDTDEKEVADSVEGADPVENEESDEMGNHVEENTNAMDENMGEAEAEQVGGSPKRDDPGRDREENAEMNLTKPSNDVFQPGISDLISDHVPNAESATQPKGDSLASDSRNIVPESNWSSGNDATNDFAPLRGLPSTSTTEMDYEVADSSNSGRFTDDQPKSQLPQHEPSSTQKTQPNPYRNFGYAFEEWKERVKVTVDLQADNTEVQGEIEDVNADEYGFVSELEKGTAQPLGPATSEQVDQNVNGDKPEEDSLTVHRDELADMEIEKQNSEAPPLRSSASIHKSKTEEHMHLTDLEKSSNEGPEEVQSHNDGNPGSLSESLVSVKKSYLSEGIHQFSKLSVTGYEHRSCTNLFVL